MDCPVCKNAMITLELADVEIDFCIDCSGIWLDAGELEILLGNSCQIGEFINSFEVDIKFNEQLRKCPICLKKMQKIIFDTPTGTIHIDKCSKGDGLWFDKNELKDIINLVPLDKENKIPKLLAEIFNIK